MPPSLYDLAMRTRSPMTCVGCVAGARRRIRRGELEVGVDPQLGQLVDDDDADGEARRRRSPAPADVVASSLTPGHTPGRAGAMATSPPLTGLAWPRSASGRRRGPRLMRRRACRRPGAARYGSSGASSAAGASSHSSIVLVELQAGLLAQVLDGARQLARVALGAQLVVELVSMTTTRPSSWATAVPGRGVARISTSSAASSTPARRTPPSGRYSTSLARAAAMHLRDRRARGAGRSWAAAA